MKIVQINAICGSGSTGKICVAISKLLTERGIENYILYASGHSEYHLGMCYANRTYIKLQALKSHLFGNYGFQSRKATNKLLKHLDHIQPNIIHLHNLHGHNINLTMFFNYVKKHQIKVIWTFHDCWAFTAYCPHFTTVGCDKWKTSCHNCPQRKEYSWFFDRSSELYRRKKELLAGLDLTIVTPSQWLATLVKQSFLKEYPVRVINNGIDLSIFKPTPSSFCKKFSIPQTRYILLGVAFDWGIRKGLDVFLDLANRLSPEEYQIVLVGTNEKIDKQLSPNIISIHRTQNQRELAEIYSAADLFVNPTREEVLGLVNIEALACGTPVVTFNSGGSPECIDETCGSVVPCDDIDSLEQEIIDICENGRYSREDCVRFAQKFDQTASFKEYVKLYDEIVKE